MHFSEMRPVQFTRRVVGDGHESTETVHGHFHQWGLDDDPFTFGIVELAGGEIVTPLPSQITFTDKTYTPGSACIMKSIDKAAKMIYVWDQIKSPEWKSMYAELQAVLTKLRQQAAESA